MIENISQSILNMWDRCPEQVRRRYFEEDVIPPGIAARIGTGLHKGAEVNHRVKRVTRKDEPLSVIQDAARDGYVKSCQNGGVFFPPDEVAGARKALAAGVDVTVKLAKLYCEKLAPKIQPELVEEKLFLEVDGISLPFSGIIDVYTEDHWLPDLKTADKKWPAGRADSEIQATFYNELVQARTGNYPKKLSFEILTKTKGEHWSFETTRTQEDWLIVIEKAKLMLRSIKAGIFPPAQPNTWQCSERFCGWWPSCAFISRRLKDRKGNNHE